MRRRAALAYAGVALVSLAFGFAGTLLAMRSRPEKTLAFAKHCGRDERSS